MRVSCESRQSGAGLACGTESFERLSQSPPSGLEWVELGTESLLGSSVALGRSFSGSLSRLRSRFPLSLHGMGLNLLSEDPLSERYLGSLARLTAELDPWLVSDHLCWTGVEGRNHFDMYPVPFNRETLSLAVERVSQVQERLGRALAVENISAYLQPEGSDRPEADFLNELCRRSGCGLVLDINNIYVNAVNHGFSAELQLRSIDREHVRLLHLSGHEQGEQGLLVSSHARPVAAELWSLLGKFLDGAGSLPVLLERDPAAGWVALEQELHRLARLLRETDGRRKGAGHGTEKLAGALC